MEPENNLGQTPQTSEGFLLQEKPFYKRKKVITLIMFLAVIVLSFIVVIFSLITKKSEDITTITPTPFQSNSQQTAKTWEVNIVYNSSNDTFVVQDLILKNYGQKQDFESIHSPYTLSIEDESKNILYVSRVPIATNIVVPKEFVGTPIEQQLQKKPIQSSFQVPYFENASSLKLHTSEGMLLEIDFPKNVKSQVESIQHVQDVNSGGTASTNEGRNSAGWTLSATPICQDGKAFIKYNYSTTSTAMIHTYDQEAQYPGTLPTWQDSSWEGMGQQLKLIGGSGEYIATGNLKENDWNSPELRFNGPVGLLKGRTYAGELDLSGDWACEEQNDFSRPGCVTGEYPINIEPVVITVKTLDENACPDAIVSPETSWPNKEAPKYTCKPDKSCSSNSKTLQICTLTCGYK